MIVATMIPALGVFNPHLAEPAAGTGGAVEADLGSGEGNGELPAVHVGERIGAAGGVGEGFPVDGVADAFARADVDQAAIDGGGGSAAGAGEDSPAWMKLGQGHAAVGVEAERLSTSKPSSFRSSAATN